jgi:hypothetical protein
MGARERDRESARWRRFSSFFQVFGFFFFLLDFGLEVDAAAVDAF